MRLLPTAMAPRLGIRTALLRLVVFERDPRIGEVFETGDKPVVERGRLVRSRAHQPAVPILGQAAGRAA